MLAALRMLVAMATLFVAVGCGPSLRRVHRSEVYFERCYAADLDRRVPVEERRACWQAWARHWQVDPDPARVDYVRERLLRLDPERAALVALATGGSDADPVPLTETTPAIAPDVQRVTEASSTRADEVSSGPTVDDAPRVEPSDGSEAELVSPPEPAPRTTAPARERRASRAAVMPVVGPPHCAAACRPSWLECTARCDEHDRFACARACRVQLRTCARACY